MNSDNDGHVNEVFKVFGVKLFPTSTVIWLLPTMRKELHTQSQI